VDWYDEWRELSSEPGTSEYYHTKQWLNFRASGQGPYFGQAVRIKVHRKKQLRSVTDRYINEVHGVAGVLDQALERNQYLVNGKSSYAEIIFVFRFKGLPWALGDAINLEERFPHVHTWLNGFEIASFGHNCSISGVIIAFARQKMEESHATRMLP
jgi:glutathione S-transferase